MYQPLQPHQIFNEGFEEKIRYTQTLVPQLKNVLTCLWESTSIAEEGTLNDVIVADGCIDLIVNVIDQTIFFSGLSRTNFHFTSTFPEHFFGFRLRPGAFFALTGIEAAKAMNQPIPFSDINPRFDFTAFWTFETIKMKQILINYLYNLAKNIRKSDYIQLFEALYQKKFPTTEILFDYLGVSPRQVQRQFKKHYGLTPQMVISVIKFQHCLKVLVESPSERIQLSGHYYDQSHFINEFKKNIGLTPLEFIKLNKTRKISFISTDSNI